MHGIPVLIKDNVDIAGMGSAGSLALADNHPADAFMVKRLRDAGAVILGKTNLSEWANFRSTRSSSGWSSRGGQTKNPHASIAIRADRAREPAARSPRALRRLASAPKPTAASLPVVGERPGGIEADRRPRQPLGDHSDFGIAGHGRADGANGVGCRAAADGDGRRRPRRSPGPAANGKIRPITRRSPRLTRLGRRFGVVRQAMGYHPDVDAATTKAIDAIKAAVEVIDVKVATYNDWNDPEFALLLYEFKDGLNAYLKKSGSPHASLEALIAWNKANAKQVMPIFGQEIFEQAQAKGPLTDAAYIARDTARRLAGKDGLIATLDKNKLDALIAPSLSPAWPTDHAGRSFRRRGLRMAAVAGTPSITVPIGDSHGLPLGLTFMGRAYSEGELIGFGFAIEQATKARIAPQYSPTVR